MENISPALESVTNSVSQHLQTDAGNTSVRDDCIKMVFSEMEYIPWDNPDNIVSAEAVNIAHQILYNVLALLVLIGVPANAMNMAVFYKQGLKDRVNLLLFALSFDDGIYLIVSIFVHGEQLETQSTTGEKYGPVMTFIVNSNWFFLLGFSFVSIILSAIIATERCLCVYNPLKFQTLIRTRTMAIIIVFLHIIVLSLFFVVVFRYRLGCVYDPETGVSFTTFVKGHFYSMNKDLIDILDTVTFGAGLLFTVLLVVVTATILTIVKLLQVVRWRAESSSSISPSEVALTKMLVGTSILFIFCFLPDAINHLSRHFIPEMNSGGRYHNFFEAALWVGDTFKFFNVTFNFFVYYAMGSRYRETLWSLFGRKPKPQGA